MFRVFLPNSSSNTVCTLVMCASIRSSARLFFDEQRQLQETTRCMMRVQLERLLCPRFGSSRGCCPMNEYVVRVLLRPGVLGSKQYLLQ